MTARREPARRPPRAFSGTLLVGAIVVAHLWLGEPVGMIQVAVVVTILVGIYLVRLAPRTRSLDR